jgi:hypothetical protein
MKLSEAITKIDYSDTVAVYAMRPFTPDSEARIGQVVFENGGLLDDMEVFANGEKCGNWIAAWLEGIPFDEREDWMALEGAEDMIAEYGNED